MEEKQNTAKFQGFDKPSQNWFKMPHVWTDLTADITSLAELKVVEYVLKHTWGYEEYGLSKKITTDEFMHGRKRKDGSRMDKGTGLSNRSVIDGLKRAVTNGYLVEETDDRDRARIKKYYGLKMAHQADVKNLHSGGEESSQRREESLHRTEIDTVERTIRKTVNGDEKKLLKFLKNLNQPKDKTEYIANYILSELGDDHSLNFYRLVAVKVPENIIRRTLSEIKVDGARSPAKVFTYRMQKYALKQLSGQFNNQKSY